MKHELNYEDTSSKKQLVVRDPSGRSSTTPDWTALNVLFGAVLAVLALGSMLVHVPWIWFAYVCVFRRGQ